MVEGRGEGKHLNDLWEVTDDLRRISTGIIDRATDVVDVQDRLPSLSELSEGGAQATELGLDAGLERGIDEGLFLEQAGLEQRQLAQVLGRAQGEREDGRGGVVGREVAQAGQHRRGISVRRWVSGHVKGLGEAV